jgi:hypothetical protein
MGTKRRAWGELPLGLMTVESVALALADPPPDTVTWFTCGEVAAAFTFTVTAIAG